jgi:hypothetical protein
VYWSVGVLEYWSIGVLRLLRIVLRDSGGGSAFRAFSRDLQPRVETWTTIYYRLAINQSSFDALKACSGQASHRSLLTPRTRLNPENLFFRFFQVKLISGQQLEIVGIILDPRQLLLFPFIDQFLLS